MCLLHSYTFSCREVKSEEISAMSNLSNPLQIPNENTFSSCLMFCYVKGRLVMWKKMFKNFSSNTPETDFTKSKIKKTWQQEHPDGTTEETTPKNRNIAAIVVLQVNKELPVSELLEFTPNKKKETPFNCTCGSTQKQLYFQIQIGQLGLFPSLQKNSTGLDPAPQSFSLWRL